MSRSVSDKVVSDVLSLAKQGLSPSEITTRLGLGNSTIYRAWKRLGLPLARDRKRTERLVKQLYDAGLVYSEIAEKAGVCKAHVYLVLGNLGVALDDRCNVYSPKPYILPVQPTALWMAEFRGLFYGEGCATLERCSSYNGYRPALHIRLRSDDTPLLRNIYETLGGYYREFIPSTRPNRSPQTQWSAYGYPRCRTIIETVFLEEAILPAHKRADILLLYEAILARYEMVWRNADLGVLADYYQKIREVKKYRL